MREAELLGLEALEKQTQKTVQQPVQANRPPPEKPSSKRYINCFISLFPQLNLIFFL